MLFMPYTRVVKPLNVANSYYLITISYRSTSCLTLYRLEEYASTYYTLCYSLAKSFKGLYKLININFMLPKYILDFRN